MPSPTPPPLHGGGGDGAGSRQPASNSVERATAENPPSEKTEYERAVEERVEECVADFRDRYPQLAEMRLSREPGQTLRADVVREVTEEEYVEGDSEFEQGFAVERLDRHEPVTWAEALRRFLLARQRYDDGLSGRFESPDGEEFDVPFNDCWTPEYAQQQRGKLAGGQRQLMGGAYPEDNEESARAGEFETGEWSDDVVTIMLTRTGSSVPDGDRVPPVDFVNEVARTWSEGGVYDRVRNTCEFDLGLDSGQWEYVRSDDVHGLDDSHDAFGGNSCYVHCHDVLFLDLSGTELREEFDSDEEIRAVLQNKFYEGAIGRHLEVCDLAEPEAHTKDRTVEVRFDIAEPAAYAAKYALLSEDQDEMLDQQVEYQAFAAVEWAANRQRIGKSKGFNAAARADLCKQNSDVDHGERLEYDRHGEVQCAHCSSSVGIDAATMTEHRITDPAPVAADGGEQVIGARVGESTAAAAARERVEEHVDQHGEPESVPRLMGELGISPEHQEVVEEVLAGENSADEIEPVMGVGGDEDDEKNELKSLVLPDGSEEPVGSAGGGAETVDLVLPVERLLRETRLKYHGEVGSPKIEIVDSSARFCTYNPETAARWLVENGYRQPWHAELVLSFISYNSEYSELSRTFEEPEAAPPDGLGAANAPAMGIDGLGE